MKLKDFGHTLGNQGAGLTPAQSQLVASRVELVERELARQGVYPQSSEYLDLRSAGYEALCDAALKFDPHKGAAFDTYATCLIKPKIAQERVAQRQRLTSKPRALKELSKLRNVRNQLRGELANKPSQERLRRRFTMGPSFEELASELAWSGSKLRRLLPLARGIVPISTANSASEEADGSAGLELVSDEPGRPLRRGKRNVCPTVHAALSRELQGLLREVLRALPVKEARAIEWEFFGKNGHPGVPAANHAQLVRQGLRRLRRSPLSAKLRKHLEED